MCAWYKVFVLAQPLWVWCVWGYCMMCTLYNVYAWCVHCAMFMYDVYMIYLWLLYDRGGGRSQGSSVRACCGLWAPAAVSIHPFVKTSVKFSPFWALQNFTQHIRSFTSYSSSVKLKFRFSSWLALVSAHLLTNFDKLLTERSDKCFYLHLALS